MKKVISILLACTMVLCCFTACGKEEEEAKQEPLKHSGLSIVTTIFPEYDWVKQITDGTDAEITMLLNSGVDLHSYQPSADDIVTISNCNVFIYVGGESDEWVEDALQEAINKDMVVVDLMAILGDDAKEEEVVEGMQAEEEEEESEGPEYDEHIWLSLKNAKTLCDAIKDAITAADPDNADIYAANTEAYINQLSELDTKYQQAVDSAKTKTILFGDRFPFRYMTDDYGLDYYAAFVGCSAESEASFETIAFLAKKVKKLGLDVVLTLEGTDHSIAETIISTSKRKGVEIKSMDSMQSTTSEDVDNGANYLSIMEKNLDVLKAALQ